MKRFTLADEFDEFLDALEHRNDFTLNRGKYRELEEKLDSITTAVAAKPVPVSPDEYLQSMWTQAIERYERVANAWTEVITDPLNALTHAALFDVREDRTADFIEAYDEAREQVRAFGSTMPAEARVEKFGSLMRRVERLWDVAYDYADRKSYSWLPAEERRQAELADKFLRMASNANDSVAQRALAAEKAAKALRAIYSIRLPDTVHGELSAMTAKALNAGKTSS